jgi:hypothetical protein
MVLQSVVHLAELKVFHLAYHSARSWVVQKAAWKVVLMAGAWAVQKAEQKG